jgi:hypothetical protein
MAEITLPRWIITQKCMPSGRRFTKKPPFPYEPPVLPQWKNHFFGGVESTQRGSETTFFIPGEIRGVFEGTEYRYWCADTSNPACLVAECRCCGSVFGNENARVLHISQMGCSKHLVAAYKLLLRDKVCLICNNKTTREKWGVPLCSSGCQQAWCEEEAQPAALKQALSLVEENP